MKFQRISRRISSLNLKRFLFCSIILLLPFNARYVFNFQQLADLQGFREPFTISFFAFDFFIILLLILYAKDHLPQLIKNLPWKKLFSPPDKAFGEEHFKAFKEIFSRTHFLQITLLLLASCQVALSGSLAFCNALRLSLVVAFYFVAKKLYRHNGALLTCSVHAFFLSGILQSGLAIIQFAQQRSLGLKMLGESVLSPHLYDVAKFEFAGEKFLRSYGTFPHPNVLGAFLVLALSCGIWLTINPSRRLGPFKSGLVLILGFFPLLTGLIFTYSRSAWLIAGLLLIFSVIFHWQKLLHFFSKLFSYLKIPLIFQSAVGITLFFGGLFLIYNLLLPRMCLQNCPRDNSFDLRVTYNQVATGIITRYPLLGIGPGNFTLYLQEKATAYSLKPWEVQPVHNFYLLVASETGLLGLGVFSFVMLRFLFLQKRARDFGYNPLLMVFLAFLLLGLVDHYFWTLTQGQLLFAFSLAFFTSLGGKQEIISPSRSQPFKKSAD